jgi:hypothetical protein
MLRKEELRCGLAPTPRLGKHAASGSDHQTRPAGAYNRSRDRCHGGNSPSLASRETPPSGREAAWAGFAELVPDTGPAVEQLPTPKVPSKGWLSALSNYPAGWLNDGLVRPAYQEARFGYVASWPIADAVATAIIATTPKPRPRLHAGIVDA